MREKKPKNPTKITQELNLSYGKFNIPQDSALWVASEPAMNRCTEELDYDQKNLLNISFFMGWDQEQQNWTVTNQKLTEQTGTGLMALLWRQEAIGYLLAICG